jgi:hypothetical protein
VVDSIFRFVGGGDSEAPSDDLLRPAMAEVEDEAVEEKCLTMRRKKRGEAMFGSLALKFLH